MFAAATISGTAVGTARELDLQTITSIGDGEESEKSKVSPMPVRRADRATSDAVQNGTEPSMKLSEIAMTDNMDLVSSISYIKSLCLLTYDTFYRLLARKLTFCYRQRERLAKMKT